MYYSLDRPSEKTATAQRRSTSPEAYHTQEPKQCAQTKLISNKEGDQPPPPPHPCTHQMPKAGPAKFNPKIKKPPPPSRPRWASNLRPPGRDPRALPVCYNIHVKPIPKPPAPGRRHTVGRRTTRSDPAPRTTTVHGAACALASTVRDGSRGRAHCAAGPPCTFRYAPSPAQTPTKIILLDGTQVFIDYNTRATHSGPPQATRSGQRTPAPRRRGRG